MARSMNSPSMRLGFSIASVRPRPGSRSSASAPVPKWTSRSSRAVERLRLLADQPGQRGRDGRGADAAADADHRGHDVRLVGLRFAARDPTGSIWAWAKVSRSWSAVNGFSR